MNEFEFSFSLTVANEMLSLLGSIQDDPFAPEHAADAAFDPPVLEDDLGENEGENSISSADEKSNDED